MSGDKKQTPGMGSVTLPRTVSDEILDNTRRSKVTATSTLDRVGEVRSELKSEIGGLRGEVGGLRGDVSMLNAVVGNLREDTGEIKGTLNTLVGSIEQDREDRKTLLHLTVTDRTAEIDIKKHKAIAEIDVEKTGKLAVIEDDKEKRAARREFWKMVAIRTIAAIGTIWGFISITYLSKCN
jgi:hypothetical protein